jgi:serine/threonine protein kinase
MALEKLQNGRYNLLRLVGKGGMGEVYLMQDERVNRQVAIKVIRSESTPYPEEDTALNAARLFQREAKAIAALEHPNILPLYDFGEEVSEDTTLSYMVMPYCTDGSLANWLRSRSPALLAPQDVAYFIAQAADALQYAHDSGVIHLDVKPPNFLLRSNRKNSNHPTIFLADFGVARSSATLSSSSHTIRGTPTAMAPEQWSSTPVHATDQYALAVMAYEMLTGRPPFVGSMEQLMYQHFTVAPPAPSTFNPNLSPSLDAVILRALAKKPEDRFPSIVAFADAFENAIMDSSVRSATNFQLVGDDLRATLAISKQEAESGISRMITLPGGQHVAVTVPAGAQQGQVIRLPNSDATSEQAEAVLLDIDVLSSDGIETSAMAGGAEQSQSTTPASIGEKAASIGQTQAVVSSVNKAVEHDLPTVASGWSGQIAPPPQQKPKRPAIQRFAVILLVAVLVLVLVLSGALFITRSFQPKTTLTAAIATGNTPTAAPSPTYPPTATATAVPNGMYIPDSYRGSMQDNTTQQTSTITVFVTQKKGSGALGGSVTFVSPNQAIDPLSGIVDMQGNFSFTIQQAQGQKPLYFYGTVQQLSDGNYLKGQYCTSNTSSCISITGIFDVGPGY